MRRRLLPFAGLLISVAAIWLVTRSVDLSATGRAIASASAAPLAATLAVIATQVVLRSYRWRALLPPTADGSRVRVVRVVPVLLTGYLGNTLLPARLGEAIRAYLISRRERLGLPEALGSVLLERVVDTATLAGIALVAALTTDRAPGWLVQGTAVAAVGAAAVLALLTLFGIRPLLARLRRIRLLGGRRGGRALDALERFASGVGGSHRRPVVALAAGISAATWLLDAATFWLVGSALGLELSYPAALLIAAVTVLGTALPSAPGYVGTFELAASATAVALGTPAEDALALAVLAHAVTVLPLAVGGGVSAALMGVTPSTLAAVRGASGARSAPAPEDATPVSNAPT